MNYRIIVLLVLCIATVAAAGCVGFPALSSDKASSSQEIIPVLDTSGRSQELSGMTYSSNAMPESGSVPSQSGSGAPTVETKIIQTAFITIEVNDVPGGVETLKHLASQKGGYISSTSIQNTFNNRLSGSVIIRIPATEFENTLAEVKSIGTVKTVSTQGRDVTEEYVDLQAQKTSYQNQLAQYNEIMKKAVNVEDVIVIQQQIDRVQTELNRLEGRLKYLNSQIDFSTITINLQEPEPVGGQSGHNFVSTINDGIAGFFGMIDAIIIIFFTLLPLLIVCGVAYGIYRWKKGSKAEKKPELPERE
ncbi:MAG: DUF4349 domain-containing protein [Methanoregula sp.]|jgi:hypothetical protein